MHSGRFLGLRIAKLCLFTIMPSWFAVYTKPRWEKKIAQKLADDGIASYCPVIRQQRKWSDRLKWVDEPAFRGYVFVNIEPVQRVGVLSCAGVLRFVTVSGVPAVIRDEEINTIRLFLNEVTNSGKNKQLALNKPVKVMQGVFMDSEGVVIQMSGNRAKVLLARLGLELVAEFDQQHLSPA